MGAVGVWRLFIFLGGEEALSRTTPRSEGSELCSTCTVPAEASSPCCSAEHDLLPGVLAETWLTPEQQMAGAELPTAAPSLLVRMPALRVRKQYKAYVSKNSKPKQGTTTVCVFFHTSKSGLGKMEKT